MSKADLNNLEKYEFDKFRQEEFKRMKKVTYLDHAGAALYSETVLADVFAALSNNLISNPHSQNVSDENLIENCRNEVLRFFNTHRGQYDVVFTSGATAALKLIGSLFPWSHNSEFCYTVDNHTSVLGIRELALERGASGYTVIDHHLNILYRFANPAVLHHCNTPQGCAHGSDSAFSLFAFPAESNFSGCLYDLDLVARIQRNEIFYGDSLLFNPFKTAPRQWRVLLDAAKFVATHPLDLGGSCQPDFVTFSFYKMCGYPTGLGALLIKKSNISDQPPFTSLLRHHYFSGGTVEAVIATEHYHVSRNDISSRFEEGSVSFLAIAALPHGLRRLSRLCMSSIQQHTDTLTQMLSTGMRAMRHHVRIAAASEVPVVALTTNTNIHKLEYRPACLLLDWQFVQAEDSIYRTNQSESYSAWIGQGPTVTFVALDIEGFAVDPATIEMLAASSHIRLRVGCFCNPGACQWFLDLSPDEVRAQLSAGYSCWNRRPSSSVTNQRPLGAIRLSLGGCSTSEDVKLWLDFYQLHFVRTIPAMALAADCAVDAVYGGVQNERDSAVGSAARALVLNHTSIASVTECIVPLMPSEPNYVLSRLLLYPVKGCSAQQVVRWPITLRGLAFDREWAIVDAVTLKSLSVTRYPQIVRLHPTVDLESRQLILEVIHDPNEVHVLLPADIAIPLDEYPPQTQSITICGDRCKVLYYGDVVSKWLDAAILGSSNAADKSLGSYHFLLTRMSPVDSRCSRLTEASHHDSINNIINADVNVTGLTDATENLSFANEAQFLLVNEVSAARLMSRQTGFSTEQSPDVFSRLPLFSGLELDHLVDQFRPNLVVRPNVVDETAHAFDEERWSTVHIAGLTLQSLGPCFRCPVINIDQYSGSHLTLLTDLSVTRSQAGLSGIAFGSLFSSKLDANSSICTLCNSKKNYCELPPFSKQTLVGLEFSVGMQVSVQRPH